MAVLFLTHIEGVIRVCGGSEEYLDGDNKIAFRAAPTYNMTENKPIFDRTGVTRWGGITFKGKMVVYAEGIDIAPANTLGLGQMADIITKQEATRIKTNLSLTKQEANSLEGITKGEAIFQLMDSPPKSRHGVIINTTTLHKE